IRRWHRLGNGDAGAGGRLVQRGLVEHPDEPLVRGIWDERWDLVAPRGERQDVDVPRAEDELVTPLGDRPLGRGYEPVLVELRGRYLVAEAGRAGACGDAAAPFGADADLPARRVQGAACCKRLATQPVLDDQPPHC